MIRRLLKHTILLLNLAAIAGLLVSGLSHLANPSDYPLMGIFGLLFPALALINIGFIIWWILLRKMLFLLSVIAIFLFSNRFADIIHMPGTKTSQISSTENIKVLSYNVRLFGLYNWRHNAEIRDSIFSFIRTESPQIACFQEYYNQNDSVFPVHDSLIRHQNFKHTHIHYTSIQSKSHMFGIATYSSYPIINKGVIPFKNTSNLAIFSDVVIGHDTIRVFNCHLESIRFNQNEYKFIEDPSATDNKSIWSRITSIFNRMLLGFSRRASQADVIAKHVAKSPYPVLLCGDFNDTPSSYVYHKLASGLNDSHREAGKGLGLTYNRIFTGFRIDYILYPDEFECINFEVKKVDFSDHRPIIGYYIIK